MNTLLYREHQKWASHPISSLEAEHLLDSHNHFSWLSTSVKNNSRSSIQITGLSRCCEFNIDAISTIAILDYVQRHSGCSCS